MLTVERISLRQESEVAIEINFTFLVFDLHLVRGNYLDGFREGRIMATLEIHLPRRVHLERTFRRFSSSCRASDWSALSLRIRKRWKMEVGRRSGETDLRISNPQSKYRIYEKKQIK